MLFRSANGGESVENIISGLYDAICEIVQCSVKPNNKIKKAILIGGVARNKKLNENFKVYLKRYNIELIDLQNEDFLFFEAIGCAIAGTESNNLELFLSNYQQKDSFESFPGFKRFLPNIKRLEATNGQIPDRLISAISIGLDIGSTGSKLVAWVINSKFIVYQDYTNTMGNPVESAIKLINGLYNSLDKNIKIASFGVTGSGREIVGAVLQSIYGTELVYIFNEIIAHAEGTLFYDKDVDTIIEIGGQDAKYIRLKNGKVTDSAMNEACSSGTGSFIEEQGKRFKNITDIKNLNSIAFQSEEIVSLGQHCSVFKIGRAHV